MKYAHRVTLAAGGAALMASTVLIGSGPASADDPNWILRNVGQHGCLYATKLDKGAEALVGENVPNWPDNPHCSGDKDGTWEFHYVRTIGDTRLYQIRLPAASPDRCLSIAGHEGGDTHRGDDTQVEACENGGDALWWKDTSASGDNIYLRNYVKGHADLYLQADPEDGFGDASAQLWTRDGSFSIQWEKTTP